MITRTRAAARSSRRFLTDGSAIDGCVALFEGVEETGLNYQSRHVRDEIYLVNWHDKDNSNFVTLIIDLARKRIHSSALLYYGSENEVESFAEAVINEAKRSA